MWLWLRRRFLTGFFVTVPLFISVAALVWIFGIVDGLTTPFYDRVLGRRIPGLGTLTTAVAILLVGAVATNVIGKRLLQRAENILLRVPVFRTIYAPVRQLVIAFSPDNESGFKRVVLIEDARRGFTHGLPDEGVHGRARRGVASHWWRCTCRPTTSIWGTSSSASVSARSYPDITVEEGIRIFLTGGMAFPPTCGPRATDRDKPGGDFRV